MKTLPHLSILITLLLFTSCFPLANLETGRTTGQNNQYIQGNIETYFADNLTEDIDGVIPAANIRYAYGLKPKLDIGISASSGGNGQIFAKYQFLGNQESKFAASVGLKIGTQFLFTEDAGPLRIYFPLFLSFHPSEKIALFLNPMYTKQMVKNDHDSDFLGLTAGSCLYFKGNELAFGASLYNIKTGRESDNLFMLGLGYNFLF